VSSLGLVGVWCFWFLFVEVYVTLHWLDWSRWIVESHDQYYHASSALVAIVAIACWQRRPLELCC
jgi:hypothetical protein